MVVAADPSDERRARRSGIGARLVLYTLALGAIFFAWHHYRGGSPSTHAIEAIEWRGITSQGQAMRAIITGGRMTFFEARVRERCSDGSGFSELWLPGNRRFVQRGEEVRVNQLAKSANGNGYLAPGIHRMRARVGDQPHGTIDMDVLLPTASGPVRCTSGPVTFALHRSR
jgi:hypothetical protein